MGCARIRKQYSSSQPTAQICWSRRSPRAPGRIDQAIEFPLPDEDSRRRLAQLYGAGLKVAEPLLEEIVRRTDRASPAFIKELMRRTAQFALDRADNGFASREDVEEALDEMLIKGGQLNTLILGGYTD